jgi:hypothetical protein
MNIRWILGLGFAVVAVAAYFVMTMVMGGEIGQPCDKEWGCKGLSAVCLEGEASFCSRHCEAAQECPDGWSCADVRVLKIDGKDGSIDESAAPVCLPPVPPQPED